MEFPLLFSLRGRRASTLAQLAALIELAQGRTRAELETVDAATSAATAFAMEVSADYYGADNAQKRHLSGMIRDAVGAVRMEAPPAEAPKPRERSRPAPLAARLAELTEARRLRSEGSPRELHDATGLAGRKARCRARTVANRLEKRLRRDVGRGAFPRG